MEGSQVKRAFKTTGAGVGVLASIALACGMAQSSSTGHVSSRHRHGPITSEQIAASASDPTTGAVAVPTSASVIPDAPCDLEAVPTLPSDLDPRVAQMSKTSPFSQALDPQRALDRDAALQQVIQASSDPSQVRMAAASRVPYSQATGVFRGGSNPLVAQTRCVWIVTVDGPFDIDSYPAGPKPPQLHGATMAIDAASGEPLDGIEGRGAPSLITGEHLKR